MDKAKNKPKILKQGVQQEDKIVKQGDIIRITTLRDF